MSHVFSVYDGPHPATIEEAIASIEALDVAFESYEAPTPNIATFVEMLLARWPDLGEPEGEDSPWSDGPMANNAAGGVIHVGVVRSMLDEAERFVVETARTLDLVVVDRAEGRVLVPDPAPSRHAEHQDDVAPRRRWFRRG